MSSICCHCQVLVAQKTMNWTLPSIGHNGEMMVEFSEDESALFHLVGCVTHIRALPDLIEKYRDVPRLYQAFIESYLVNYRLLFEFFDKFKDEKDFAAQTFLPNWSYEFDQDAKDVFKSASQHVVHFSKERLVPEVVTKEFPIDPTTLKGLNNLLEAPLRLFRDELLAKSPELGEFFCFWLPD